MSAHILLVEDDPQAPKHILTARGEGYWFRK